MLIVINYWLYVKSYKLYVNRYKLLVIQWSFDSHSVVIGHSIVINTINY